MALQFDTVLAPPPLPVDAASAARQAVLVAGRIAAAGGIPAAVTAAVQVILDASEADPPSELLRLRLLYREAYTAAELERFVLDTFVELGLAERPV